MGTPKRSVTPISKLKFEDSPVFNYINSLSPIKPLKPNPVTHTLSSLSFNSPVFSSPHKESRFISNYNSSVPNKDGFASMEEEEEGEGEVIIDASNNIGSCEDVGETTMHKMCDNVKAKCDTPDWETLISDTTELLIYGSPSNSEALRCLLHRKTNSQAPTMETISNNNESNKSYDVSNALSIVHRGVRRRCLDFEIPRDSYKQMSRNVGSSIGLNLNNTIAMSYKDNNVGHEYSFSRNLKTGLQDSTDLLLHSHEVVREEEPEKIVDKAREDAPRSPKKKRRKPEQGGEGDSSSCKRCNCKKSKCLKLYCECFAAGVYCIEPCSCVDCFNKPMHEDIVLATRKQIESRNPLAFAPKVIRTSDSIIQVDESKTPASARHKRGCNCKKSNCLKKYCECYQSGVGCSINCRCEGCKNAFGRKDGSLFVGMDIEEEEDENATHNVELYNHVIPSTPMPLRQPLAQLHITSNNKMLPPPQCNNNNNHHHGGFGSRIDETITEDNLNQSPITKTK
ncbi:unnamed protein product [Cochlearia groenlandica]